MKLLGNSLFQDLVKQTWVSDDEIGRCDWLVSPALVFFRAFFHYFPSKMKMNFFQTHLCDADKQFSLCDAYQ